MGISIDEAIKMQEEIIDEGWLISDLEKCPAIDSCELAIDIMRKYQQIEQIVSDRYGKPMLKFMDAIVKVVEDEKR